MAEGRAQEAQAFAAQIRDELGRLSETVGRLMDESVQLEQAEIMPRLEAAIGDFTAAAGAARGLSRGGTKAESNNAWRSVANAQFNAGRCQWETGSIFARRGDALARIAAGGALLDPAAIRSDIEGAEASRKEAFTAAEDSFNQALESIGRMKVDELRRELRRVGLWNVVVLPQRMLPFGREESVLNSRVVKMLLAEIFSNSM